MVRSKTKERQHSLRINVNKMMPIGSYYINSPIFITFPLFLYIPHGTCVCHILSQLKRELLHIII